MLGAAAAAREALKRRVDILWEGSWERQSVNAVPQRPLPTPGSDGFDQGLLLNTLCKQVRDEAQAQSKSLTSSSAVAVSMVVAALLLGNPFSSLMPLVKLEEGCGCCPCGVFGR